MGVRMVMEFIFGETARAIAANGRMLKSTVTELGKDLKVIAI